MVFVKKWGDYKENEYEGIAGLELVNGKTARLKTNETQIFWDMIFGDSDVVWDFFKNTRVLIGAQHGKFDFRGLDKDFPLVLQGETGTVNTTVPASSLPDPSGDYVQVGISAEKLSGKYRHYYGFDVREVLGENTDNSVSDKPIVSPFYRLTRSFGPGGNRHSWGPSDR